MSKTSDVMPMVQSILDSEWKRILRPVLMKRIGLMVSEIEAMDDEAPAQPPIDLAAIREVINILVMDGVAAEFHERLANKLSRALGDTP